MTTLAIIGAIAMIVISILIIVVVSLQEGKGDGITALAGVSAGLQGTGGMITKLRAAQICMSCGCSMVIANGRRPENLYDILEGKDIGTTFEEETV